MPGSLQHHHHRGHLDEREEVGRLLLVPRATRRYRSSLTRAARPDSAPGTGPGRRPAAPCGPSGSGITAPAPRDSIASTTARLSYPLSAMTASVA